MKEYIPQIYYVSITDFPVKGEKVKIFTVSITAAQFCYCSGHHSGFFRETIPAYDLLQGISSQLWVLAKQKPHGASEQRGNSGRS